MANGPTNGCFEIGGGVAGAISCAAAPPLRLWIRLNAAGTTSTIQLGPEKEAKKVP